MGELTGLGHFGVMTVGVLILLVFDGLKRESWPRATLIFLILGVAIWAIFVERSSGAALGRTVLAGHVFCDSLAFAANLTILSSALVSLFLVEREVSGGALRRSPEVLTLFLLLVAGGCLLATSASFMSAFLGLELLSLSLYPMCAARLDRSHSAEAGIKYFILGSFSSAVMLFGIALVFGSSGSLDLAVLGELTGGSNVSSPAGLVGLFLFLVGGLFKVGAAPFHFWVPDAYEGAPLSVTALMSTTVKASALFFVHRILGMLGMGLADRMIPFLWLVAFGTLVVGAVGAQRQRNVKRLLAYSGILNVGYLLVLLLTVPGGLVAQSVNSAWLFYLVSYLILVHGCFTVLLELQSEDGSESVLMIESTGGMLRRHPLFGLALCFFMLALAGLPPGVVGFVAKFNLFQSALAGGYLGLVIVAFLASVVSAYYYLRIFRTVAFDAPIKSEQLVASFGSTVVVTACFALAVVFSLFPESLYGFFRVLML